MDRCGCGCGLGGWYGDLIVSDVRCEIYEVWV